jgi:hypothetical protein
MAANSNPPSTNHPDSRPHLVVSGAEAHSKLLSETGRINFESEIETRSDIPPAHIEVERPTTTSYVDVDYEVDGVDKQGRPSKTKYYEQYLITNHREMKQILDIIKWKNSLPEGELKAALFVDWLMPHIRKDGGTFLRDEVGEYHILIGDKRIPITADSIELSELMLKHLGITIANRIGQIIVRRLQIIARAEAKQGMVFRRHSAARMVDHTPRIWIPLHAGKVLRVTDAVPEVVPNGTDGLWVEHPGPAEPLKWGGAPTQDEMLGGLKLFEDLLIKTQATTDPWRWFVGMAEGLFPFVRDLVEQRALIVHVGPKGSGKTTGARWFLKLHGLGKVHGDSSVASLNNMPEVGLLVLDNKEHRDWANKELTNYAVFLATDADNQRSNQDGTIRRRNPHRPVAVITTIEGVPISEVRDRCVYVPYRVDGRYTEEDPITAEIIAHRDEILRALAVVLQEFAGGYGDPTITPSLPNVRFAGHIAVLARLLIAYGRITRGGTRDGDAWAKDIISAWTGEIGEARTGQDEDGASGSAWEQPILSALRSDGAVSHYAGYDFRGTVGTLWVTNYDTLMPALRNAVPAGFDIPQTTQGVSARIQSEEPAFTQLKVLRHRTGKDPDVPEVARTRTTQRIGFFLPSDVEPEAVAGGEGEKVVRGFPEGLLTNQLSLLQ